MSNALQFSTLGRRFRFNRLIAFSNKLGLPTKTLKLFSILVMSINPFSGEMFSRCKMGGMLLFIYLAIATNHAAR